MISHFFVYFSRLLSIFFRGLTPFQPIKCTIPSFSLRFNRLLTRSRSPVCIFILYFQTAAEFPLLRSIRQAPRASPMALPGKTRLPAMTFHGQDRLNLLKGEPVINQEIPYPLRWVLAHGIPEDLPAQRRIALSLTTERQHGIQLRPLK